MKTFVTGGSGFVGANLVAALNQRGWTPHVLMRPSSPRDTLAGLAYEPVYGDVLDSVSSLAQAMEGTEWVFHVAAVSDYWRQSRERIYRVNVDGTQRMVDAAALAEVGRFVYTSSLAAMGIPAPGKHLTEADHFNLRPGRWPYGHSKSLAEQVVRGAVQTGLDAVIVNPTAVLGPRGTDQMSSIIISLVARGLTKVSPPGGANYIHVNDVTAGHIAAAERGRTGERYILGSENVTHVDALRLVAELVGQSGPRLTAPGWLLPPASLLVRFLRVFFGTRVQFDEDQMLMMGAGIYADAGKAVRELALPQTTFKQTLIDTIAWYRENGYL